jgi:phosphatidylethanolamine-binding protein (PEBP) family uncharacterized protein
LEARAGRDEVICIPGTATGLPSRAGNAGGELPVPAFGGENDFVDTGATGANGAYGGPCPPSGDKPHRYVFTIYALAVDNIDVAAARLRLNPSDFADGIRELPCSLFGDDDGVEVVLPQ